MALADDEQRRTSFGTIVDAGRYEDVRPGYDPAAVEWLVGRPSRPLRVLDLAAGTGKLTRVLASQGHEVVAVDPSEGMLETLGRTTAESLPPEQAARVEAHVGTAEEIPLPDASVDAVTVGQAWHWLRPAAAVAEVARVLRPGGTLGLAWNARDLSVQWAHDFEELVEGTGFAEAVSTSADPETAVDADAWWPRVPAPMTDRERAQFPAAQRLASPDDVAALASTYSGVAVRPDREAVLEQVRELARRAAEPDGSVVVPLVCHCFRYRRP
jgi:SAM-dependent methyltransferase